MPRDREEYLENEYLHAMEDAPPEWWESEDAGWWDEYEEALAYNEPPDIENRI